MHGGLTLLPVSHATFHYYNNVCIAALLSNELLYAETMLIEAQLLFFLVTSFCMLHGQATTATFTSLFQSWQEYYGYTFSTANPLEVGKCILVAAGGWVIIRPSSSKCLVALDG